MVRVARAHVLFCRLSYTDGSPWAGVGWGRERTVSYPLAENCCSFLVKVLIYCYKPLPLLSFYRERQAFRLCLLNDPTDFFSKTTYVSSAACLQMSQNIR